MIGGGVIARLRAVMGLDTKEFETGIRDSKAAAKTFQASIKDIAGALGIAFSVGAVVQFGKSFMEWAGKISDAAGNVGILTSEMASLNAVFAKQGLGVEDLSKMFAKIEGDVFAAASGTKELDKIYGKLGFTLESLAGMSPDERFRALAKAAVESANATGALAELFGTKLGPKARLAIEDIVDGYDKMDDATGRAMDKVDEFGDKVAGLKEKIKQGLAGTYVSWWIAQFGRTIDLISSLKVGDPFGTVSGYREKQAAGKEEEQGRLADAIRLRAKERQDLIDLARKTADEKAEIEVKKQGEAALKAYEKWKEGEDKKAAEQRRRWAEQRRLFVEFEKDKAELAARFEERKQSIFENTRGVGVSPDAMARIGGFAGNERAGLAQLDRQIQVQRETTKALQDLTTATAELKTAYETASGKTGSAE